ncbi:response regulator [Accumulibacter sp.]|uniref:response regulator n=1 Tax=Accumulibacter sp. TaxID=2053492 RepID=UPI002D027246|nr:response regulator [Accumulibacter sp.]HNE39244.1 response regulator [Accumulibacter sp.]
MRDAASGRERLSPGQSEHLATVHRSGEHLLTLVNKVLDLSRIEAGRTVVTPSDFDLCELLAGLKEMCALVAANKGLTLRASAQFLGSAEAGSKPGSPVRLSFEVADSGVGIAAEDLAGLFQPFVQSARGQKHGEGSGLGLAITHEFAELLGGTIEVHSTLGVGTTFTFTIVAHEAAREQPLDAGEGRPVVGLAPGQAVWRILVADDDAGSGRLLVQMLKPPGFAVEEAGDGQAAITVWERWHPHLIWMDMRMPNLDGWQATQRIKSAPGGADTKIVALAASSFEEERAEILAEGCDDFLRKPYRAATLLEMIEKHLGVRYIYGEAAEAAPAMDDRARVHALQSLPDEWLARLEEAAIRAEMNRVEQLIEEVSAQSQAIAVDIQVLADDFDYRRIIALVQRARRRAHDQGDGERREGRA